MSTPTPAAMKHATSQQGRTPSGQQGRTPSHFPAATPPVSTPFNAAQAAFSPRGQHSSPQHVKKSPATMGMTGQSTMAALNFDSPSTAAAMGALVMGNGFDMGLEGVAGLDGVGGAYASEEEKLRRLENIIKMLNVREKKGMVSDAGLERLAQRLGMEILSEEHSTPGGHKTKTLAIAGSAIALDIVLDNNIVQNATLSYHGNADSVTKHIDAASQILLKDLQLSSGQSPLTKTLERFAINFERLARLDKLSIVPGLDCHEALSSMHSSLGRLYGWDLEQLRRTMTGRPDSLIESSAMCTRHGRPVMHERGQVGLALQYWKERRFIAPRAGQEASAQNKVWSMLLGCAAIDGVGLPPVRVSENWISKDIVKQDDMSGALSPPLDWQEPDNVSLPQNDENKDAGMDMLQADLSTTRVPRVMFTATFDPPIILPQSEWSRFYAIVGLEPPMMTMINEFNRQPPTFDQLFFPVMPGTKQDISEPRTIVRRHQVPMINTYNDSLTRTHKNSLFIYKPIYSQELSELPFGHPRQLIEMLPVLRQYAFLSTLLESSFGRKDESTAESGGNHKAEENEAEQSDSSTMKDQLAEFMNLDKSDAKSNAGMPVSVPADLSLDVILWVHPSPHMQVVFPMRDTTANITLSILEGGLVQIIHENVIGEEPGPVKEINGSNVTREQLAKVLEHLEDLSKWAEWIRSRL
ncbi:Mediator complex, subunit Med1 [Cordyceps fumosorosea ARSEF 2679]|uniref:Mediator of RNA polymerase II transcription subunit 1 n=1 Tax=Cordyceps fumosorosea (strain ARSEF 2679) TaxID=1081104 RepID=A0A167QIH9_CORFA|nr:Mediator complex, subunit Med1 [Cordyceps fumosorosea ARSEF 2679]OAA57671.1 Mediator complex, subunit Med1 [Cordyceps fumosorosea ARSEF 2679]